MKFPPFSSRSSPIATRRIGIAGALVSAGMLTIGAVQAWRDADLAHAAAIDGGAITVVGPPGTAAEGLPLNSGGSASEFVLRLPAGSACSGDSANDGYQVQSYMVPSTVDPSSLTFDSQGPTPNGTGAALRLPLYDTQGSGYIDQLTDITTGFISGLPKFWFGIFGADGPTVVPAGTYNVGIACTKGLASATQLDKYWNAQFTIAHSASDEPAGLTWTVVNNGTGSSTTSSSTTSSSTSSTVTSSSSSSTSSTSTSTSTSTTLAATVAGTTVAPTTTISAAVAGGNLPRTGPSSTVWMTVWGVLLLVFGRMAVLAGREIKVIPADS